MFRPGRLSSVPLNRSKHYRDRADVVLYLGRCQDLLQTMPDACVDLVITSPPYNTGKPYEDKRQDLSQWLDEQREVIRECVRTLTPGGSICWQLGNHVRKDGSVLPLDMVVHSVFIDLGLQLRNRIVWTYGHGLHAKKKFSGRYEVILWFTRPGEKYTFNLDAVRVPQKYPGKRYYKGPKAGKLSGNPLGSNPGDVWDIPNVKANHVEKTGHPCQFPLELIERLVLALSSKGDRVFDPFCGAATALVAALKHKRKAVGSDSVRDYIYMAMQRIHALEEGRLPFRAWGPPQKETRNKKEMINYFTREVQ
jgi:adenine-specific DNA-methyltransferase